MPQRLKRKMPQYSKLCFKGKKIWYKPTRGKWLRRCMLWPFEKTVQGYGIIRFGKIYKMAHRVVYESVAGKVAKGLVLDHLCRKPACVNPKHLRVVTHGENSRCGNGVNGINFRKTHCDHGHPLFGDNVYLNSKLHRYCKACMKECSKRYRANKVRRLKDRKL